MNRYESYENTGLDWVPEIPKHWSVTRSKFIFRNKSVKNCPDEPLLSVTQKDGVVLRSESDLNVWNPTEDVSGYKLIEPSNFVISLRSFEGGLELSTIKGIVSPAYTVLEKTKKINDPYFRWLMKSHQFIIELNKHVTGIRQGKNIGWDDFSNIYLTVPPIQEQKLISRYLDKKTSQIDSLVEKIQKKIELLKEQRTSLINHYVTKGLDPNVEMKDSGVEWIGEIPKHWKTVKSSYIIDIRDGTHDTPLYVDHGFPLVTQKDIYGGVLSFEKTKMISEEDHMEISKRSGVVRNDIIMSMIGSIGYPTVVDTDVEFSIKNVCLFKTSDSKQNPKFIKYFLESTFVANQLELGKGGGVQSFVSLDVLRNLKFIVPSRTEQNRIVEHLEKKDLQIKDIIFAEDRRITLLKEYRQSLISSVVTGKIRVTEDMI